MEFLKINDLKSIVRKFSKKHNIVSGTSLRLDLSLASHRNILKAIKGRRLLGISLVEIIIDDNIGKLQLFLH